MNVILLYLGQKYMGLWLEDQKHGNGVIVTLDGMYFEGTFQQNKMTVSHLPKCAIVIVVSYIRI